MTSFSHISDFRQFLILCQTLKVSCKDRKEIAITLTSMLLRARSFDSSEKTSVGNNLETVY